MQHNERLAGREETVVSFLKMAHTSIIARGLDDTIPKAKYILTKEWIGIITSQIIK
jgi:hypothetical protein